MGIKLGGSEEVGLLATKRGSGDEISYRSLINNETADSRSKVTTAQEKRQKILA